MKNKINIFIFHTTKTRKKLFILERGFIYVWWGDTPPILPTSLGGN